MEKNNIGQIFEAASAEKPDLSLVILCYRAEESLKFFIAETIKTLAAGGVLNYELVLVGNYLKGVQDKTPRVVQELAEHNPRINCVVKEKRGMMGWDMKSGLALAAGKYIAVIDGDGQMPIKDVVTTYKLIYNSGYDLVKTYRVHRGDTVWRKTVSFIYNLFFHWLFPGLNSRDINSKPKILTRRAYEKLNLISDDWFIDAEIMIQARRNKFRIGEVPTVFYKLTLRDSFVRYKTIIEFIKNLIIFRIAEFKK